MKKILVPMVFAVSLFSCQEKKSGDSFTVEGVVKNTTAPLVYLEENPLNSNPVILDSFQLKENGSFTLKGKSKEEGLYQLRLKGKLVPFALLINDEEKIKVEADINNTTEPYTVQGSTASQALIHFDKASYEKGMALFVEGSRMDSLQKAKAPDSVIAAQYAKVEQIASDIKTAAQETIARSNSPMLSLYVLSSYQNTSSNLGIPGFDKTEIAQLVNGAAAKFPAHSGLQNIKKTLPSAKATDFTQPDVNGQPVSLSQFRGKYVLVDFWASWCQPCRMENPNVVRTYNEFKDKNFTILGVSLDQNKEAWLKAIQQDGLTWTHVSDLKFWNNAAAVQYGVQSIPYNVLLDPQGNIVAENLHGEELTATLRKVVK